MLNIVILFIAVSDLNETLNEKEFVMPQIVTEFTKNIFEHTGYYLENPMEIFSNPIMWIFIALSIGLMFRFIYIITDEFEIFKKDEEKNESKEMFS